MPIKNHVYPNVAYPRFKAGVRPVREQRPMAIMSEAMTQTTAENAIPSLLLT